MLIGERIWIEIKFKVRASGFGKCTEINLIYWIEVSMNAKGGVSWHCSVSIDVNRAMVLLVICRCVGCFTCLSCYLAMRQLG